MDHVETSKLLSTKLAEMRFLWLLFRETHMSQALFCQSVAFGTLLISQVDQSVMFQLGLEAGELYPTLALLVASLLHSPICIQKLDVLMGCQNMLVETPLVFKGARAFVALEGIRVPVCASVSGHVVCRNKLPTCGTRNFGKVFPVMMNIQFKRRVEDLVTKFAILWRKGSMMVVHV